MADINKIKIGIEDPEAIMYSQYQELPSDYRYNLKTFTINTEATPDADISYNKIIIRKFKPNVWILKSPKCSSLTELCAESKNLIVSIKGISNNSELFNKSYQHHSVVGGSGGVQGYIRGVGIFPFSDDITGWQLSSYGQYAKNRGELPFSAYIWDSLTYTDGTTAQVASETTAFRGDWGAGYNAYGKLYDGNNKKVIPDYSTFPTPYNTLRLSVGLYTGNAISFEAWECENRINALKMSISTRNEEGVGSTRAAYCYSNFGTISIKVSGLSVGDRLEYSSGITESSSSSIIEDGEYSISYSEGKGFILYGDTENTSTVTIELINNKYLDEEGYVDISNNPITISLLNEKGIDPSSTECWNVYCGDTQIYHKDKTTDNCWIKYGMMFPFNWEIHRNNLGTNENIEWVTPLKFIVKKVPTEGIVLSTKVSSFSGVYTDISYPSFQVRVLDMPSNVTAKVERVFTNTSSDVNTSVTLENGINTIEAFSKVIYRQDSSSTMTATQAKLTISSDSGSNTRLIVEIIPVYTDGGRRSLNTTYWSNILNRVKVPEATDITDEVMQTTTWNMTPNNESLWNTIKTWYENNNYYDTNFIYGNVFSNSGGLTEISIRLPNFGSLYGEDNFANSDIETINFIQEGTDSHFSAPQRLLRSAFNLKNINITWADPDNPTYICGANTIVDGMSCGLEIYPERFIKWNEYRSNVWQYGIHCTLFHYAFNNARSLITIPSFPSENEDDNTIIAAYTERAFNDCKSLTTVGPILNMIIVQPSKALSMFYNCTSLSSIKIKNLNHGDWSFDNETRNGVYIGTLKSLDTESVDYLFNNLSDLTTYDVSKHEDTIDKSFKNWISSYFNGSTITPDWDYTLSLITQFTCRKRYSTKEDAPFIVYTNEELRDMEVHVSGLQNGDYVIFGEDGSAESIVTWTQNDTKSVSKAPDVTMGFKLMSSNTDSKSQVTITIVNGLDYTNPGVSSANLYCPEEWADKVTSEMVETANAKGWTIYIGGVLTEPS